MVQDRVGLYFLSAGSTLFCKLDPVMLWSQDWNSMGVAGQNGVALAEPCGEPKSGIVRVGDVKLLSPYFSRSPIPDCQCG